MNKEELKNYIAEKEICFKRRKQEIYSNWKIRLYLRFLRHLYKNNPDLIKLANDYANRKGDDVDLVYCAIMEIVSMILYYHNWRYDRFVQVSDNILSKMDSASEEDIPLFYTQLEKI